MNDFLVMTMTDAGRLSILNYIDSGFSLSLSHIGVGSGNYTHTAKTPAMINKWADFPVISGTVDETTNCLILTTMGQVHEVIKVSELGLYSNSGQLIAVVAKPSGYFFQTEPGAFFSFTISIALGQKINGKKLTLSFASQEQIASALIALHLQHKNPHPQYRAHMTDLLKQHLATAHPHGHYALKADATALINKQIAYVDRLIDLFLSFFGKSLYLGCYQNPGANGVGYTVDMGSDFTHDLRDPSFGVLFTPEGNHEAWEILRGEKSIYCHTFQRSGRGRTGYAGPVNWTVLTDITGSPIAEMAVSELITVGVGQPRKGGYLDINVPDKDMAQFQDLCILICPEQHHEGWQLTRNTATKQINLHAYRRKNISRESWDYTGLINYVILRPKAGTDLSPPTVFPCLLMAGNKTLVAGNFTIQRPAGQTWDLTNPNFVIHISPDSNHEGWVVTRAVDRISVYVFERVSKEGRGNAVGKCNFAIFQKERI